MKQTFLIIPLILFIALSSPGELHATNLVFNGNLELPGFSVPAYYRYLYNGDSTTIQGWTVYDDGIGEASYLMNRGGYSVYEGNYTLSLNQGSSIRTTFASIANVSYQLSFYASISAHPNATPLKVQVGEHVATFSQSGIQIYDFVATSTNSNTLLEFINDGPVGDFKIHTLDVISIVVIPEPTTMVCLFMALVLACFRKR